MQTLRLSASREVLCSQILGVAADAVSLADEVIQAQLGKRRTIRAPHHHRSRFAPIHDSLRTFERSPTPDVRAFTPSPPLDSWILEYLAAEWPGFRDLRSAASALGQRDRLRNAVSVLVNDVRVAMAGAFLTATRRPSLGAAGPLSAEDAARIDADVERARDMHSCARSYAMHGLSASAPYHWILGYGCLLDG